MGSRSLLKTDAKFVSFRPNWRSKKLVKSEKGSLIPESTDDNPNLNFAVIVTIALNVLYSRLKHFSQPENALLKQLELDQRTFISSFPTDWAGQSKTNWGNVSNFANLHKAVVKSGELVFKHKFVIRFCCDYANLPTDTSANGCNCRFA